MEPLPDTMTLGEKYGPAMQITDQAEADEYFEACVCHQMKQGYTRDAAESIERQNLGYYAGYYDDDTRRRVERLFDCRHPVFGKAADGAPNPHEAFEMGYGAASKTRGD